MTVWYWLWSRDYKSIDMSPVIGDMTEILSGLQEGDRVNHGAISIRFRVQ